MNQITKAIAIPRTKVKVLIQFIVLTGIATIAPFFLHQFIAGPLVNAVLFIATVLIGPYNTLILALLPSTIALSVGLLPPVLAPMIPFIMLGNIILVYAFNAFWKKNYWLGVGVSSVVKWLFLWGSSYVVVQLLLKKEVAEQVSLMMSWPQLLTAVGGGILAYIFLKAAKKLRAKDSEKD